MRMFTNGEISNVMCYIATFVSSLTETKFHTLTKQVAL